MSGADLPPSRKPLRILILSHFFPPLNSIGSHRPYSWARAWSDLGHRVQVLTTQKMAYDGSLDLRFDLSGFEVETVPYLTAPRGAPSVRADSGVTQRWERIKRMTRRLRFGMGLFADLRTLAWRPLARRALALHAGEPFDFVISTYQPEVSHLAAASFVRRTGLPWVADYRDLWHIDISGQSFAGFSAASAVIERRAVSQARLISTISEGLAAELSRRFRQPVFVCYNGYLPASAAVTNAGPTESDVLRLVHTGRLYRDRRDPEPLLQALEMLRDRAPEPARRIRLELYGPIEPWLVDRVKARKLEEMVHLAGMVPFDESLRAQQQSHALVFFDWTGGGVEGIVSGKLFEYLGSRRPILFIGGSENSEAARIARQCGAAVVLAGAQQIADWLEANDPSSVSSWRPDMDAIASFSRIKQAERLLQRITAELQAARC